MPSPLIVGDGGGLGIRLLKPKRERKIFLFPSPLTAWAERQLGLRQQWATLGNTKQYQNQSNLGLDGIKPVIAKETQFFFGK